VSNNETQKVNSFYDNNDMRVRSKPYQPGTFCFRAQYRQCAPLQEAGPTTGGPTETKKWTKSRTWAAKATTFFSRPRAGDILWA